MIDKRCNMCGAEGGWWYDPAFDEEVIRCVEHSPETVTVHEIERIEQVISELEEEFGDG